MAGCGSLSDDFWGWDGPTVERYSKIMTTHAETFIAAFEQVCQEQLPTLLECWPSQPKFTSYVSVNMMPRLADILGCTVEYEHNRIDHVLRANEASSLGIKPGDIFAAIEHENNFGNSHEEIIKLTRINAPLGVLITYASPWERGPKLAEYIEHVVSEVGGKEQGELLVIFGPYGLNRPVKLEWDYHVWRGDRFRGL